MSAVAEQTTTPAEVKKNYITAMNETLFAEMERNPDMVCLGEDIGLLGGAFGVTDGLQAAFGSNRVMDMPISEAAIVGVGVGAALNGKTVMVEMQFIDFISTGFDQIVNMAATYHYRTAGEVNLPLVIRGPAGGYGGGALYHSQMNEAWFANSPGLKIVCPSTPSDAAGLLRSALRDGNPVLIYDIKNLYRERSIMEVVPDEHIVPLGSASIRREGTDLTMVTYGNPVYLCLEAAEKLAEQGINAEVIDIRSLVPLDEETIFKSIAKTNRVLVVNEAPMTCGFAGEICARIAHKAFTYLDAPVSRVTRLDTPVPWVKPLEDFVLPQTNDIYEEALRVVNF